MAKRKTRRGGSGQIAVPSPTNQQESVSIRKIKNGYLISRSGSRRGKYFTEDEFSPGRPAVMASIPKPTPAKAPARRRQSRAASNEVGHLRGP